MLRDSLRGRELKRWWTPTRFYLAASRAVYNWRSASAPVQHIEITAVDVTDAPTAIADVKEWRLKRRAEIINSEADNLSF